MEPKETSGRHGGWVRDASSGRDEVRLRAWAGHILLGLICVAMAGLVGRLAYIQVEMRPALLAWSERRQCSEVPLPGRRGAILDRRGRVLAGSHDAPMVYADPRAIEDRSAAARDLGMVLGMPAEEVSRLLSRPTSPGFVVIRRGVPAHEAREVESLKIPGVGVANQPTRTYPMGPVAAHVIGFVGSDGGGLEGIERSLDKVLRGRDGKRVVYRDTKRRAVFQQPDSYESPEDGKHVVLTLDSAMQEVLETEIRGAVERFKAESGLGLLMCPQTGAILALACYPTYNPVEAGKVAADLRRNRVLTDPVEPGSIFKPFVMAGAFEHNLARPSETIFCHNGLYATGKRRLHDHHPYGHLTVEQILTKSSNIGMAILGQRLGNARMHETLSKFGFGRRTGIDLPGEGLGLFMPLKAWNSFTTTSVPMGHEMALTPIQLATGFAVLVNGGRLVRPYVVSAIADLDGQVIEDRRPEVDPPQVISAETAATMHELLVKTVNEGTGRPSQLAKWQVMGKTGTAQIPRFGGRGYEPNAYLGSFMAAAPASDPSVVALVMIRKPDRRIAYYGGAVAAPTVKVVLEQVLAYMGAPPDKGETAQSRLALSTPEAFRASD